MTREEFMDLLRYYFRNINQTQVNEILADYESHFEEGKAAGLSEEEIARELGSPKEIFEMYQDEGMIQMCIRDRPQQAQQGTARNFRTGS